MAGSIAGLLLCADRPWAQTAPDAGSLLRESERQLPKLPQLPVAETPKLLQDHGAKVVVKRFVVEGSSRYPAARLDALLADMVDEELGFAQLQAAADRIAALYRQDGLHATAYLPEQTLKEGVVRIVVVEGRLGKLKLDPKTDPNAGKSGRLPLGLIERMLAAGQQPGQMIDTGRLERATLLANDIPGVQVSSLLGAGEVPGETDIVAQIDPRPLLGGIATLDNEDPRATGRAKAGVSISLAEPIGFGDQAQLNANLTEGKDYLRAAYEVPLGASGWRAGVNASSMHYRLQGEFSASGGKGRATTWGATSLYPVLRGVESNLYATAAFDHRRLVNESNAGQLSDKTVQALTLGANGDATDTRFGGGANIGGFSLVVGHLSLGRNDADLAADQAGPNRNGGYLKFSANLARLQRLTENGSLWLTASGQLANKNLDSSEQMSLGGSSGVRAYPALEGSGDAGWIGTVEYRHRLNDAWQLTAFYDHGRISRSHSPADNAPQPNNYALKGLGAGVVWRVKQYAVLHAMVATRVGGNPAASSSGQDSDGTKRRPQFWLLAEVPF